MSDFAMQRVGPLGAGLGVATPQRADPTSAQVVTQGHGRYTEACRLKHLHILNSGAVTLAATHTSGSNLGTATFIDGFYNPYGSGVVAAIIRAAVMVTSGTPTGGFVWNYYPDIAISSAATGVIRHGYLCTVGAGGVSNITPQVNVALVSLYGITPALIEFDILGGPAAVAAGAGIYSVSEDIGGYIQVPPGCICGLMQVGASTAVVRASIAWEEYDL